MYTLRGLALDLKEQSQFCQIAVLEGKLKLKNFLG